MKSLLFGRHRVRANFYHLVGVLYLVTMVLWIGDLLSDSFATWFGFFLFAVDYLAQMYDPHPDNPGPWFRIHFWRLFDEDKLDLRD